MASYQLLDHQICAWLGLDQKCDRVLVNNLIKKHDDLRQRKVCMHHDDILLLRGRLVCDAMTVLVVMCNIQSGSNKMHESINLMEKKERTHTTRWSCFVTERNLGDICNFTTQHIWGPGKERNTLRIFRFYNCLLKRNGNQRPCNICHSKTMIWWSDGKSEAVVSLFNSLLQCYKVTLLARTQPSTDLMVQQQI